TRFMCYRMLGNALFPAINEIQFLSEVLIYPARKNRRHIERPIAPLPPCSQSDWRWTFLKVQIPQHFKRQLTYLPLLPELVEKILRRLIHECIAIPSGKCDTPARRKATHQLV